MINSINGKEETITNIFGQKKILSKFCYYTFTHNDVVLTEKFYITESEENIMLLCKDTLEKLKILKIQINNINKQHKKLFDLNKSEVYKGEICEINTKDGIKVRQKGKDIDQIVKNGTEKAINDLLERNIIEISKSSWINPLRPVIKNNNVEDIRITNNFMFLNKITEADAYHVPKIERCIEELQGKKWFTVIDIKDGYFNIELKKEHRHKTAFYFNNRLYQYTRMPQGFKNSGAIFQRIMDNILKDDLGVRCTCYMDDIVVFGVTEKEHDINLEIILNKLEDANLSVNSRKLQYKQNIIKFLGSVTDGTEIRPKTEARYKSNKLEEPKSRKELQRILGFYNFYRKFIKNYSKIAAPLYELLESQKEYMWNDEHRNILNKIKEIFNSDVKISIPNYNHTFILTTDASQNGLGFILEQIDDENNIKVIDWGSKKLTKSEQKWTITEKELLAVCLGVEHFSYYLKNRYFKIYTDHKAIESIVRNCKATTKRLDNLLTKLQEFNFTLEYKKGKDIDNADSISREFINEEQDKNKELIRDIHINKVGHKGSEQIKYYIKQNNLEIFNESKLITEVLQECKACLKNKQQDKDSFKFVQTKAVNDIAALDLVDLNDEGYSCNYIEYYTRKCKCIFIVDKTTETIINTVKTILKEMGKPKTLICDNAKELTSNEFKTFLADNNIILHKTTPYRHESNGRIERLNREMRNYLRKSSGKNFKILIEEFNRIQNNTYHRGIDMTPEEAWMRPNSHTLRDRNLLESDYAQEFYTENSKYKKFKEDEPVLYQREFLHKLKNEDKKEAEGTILKDLENNSCLIKDSINSKIYKRDKKNVVTAKHLIKKKFLT